MMIFPSCFLGYLALTHRAQALLG
ncbi:hypothetical protein CBM2626_A10026 [Cupriavidus taiwanensis]|nr:hypothetical protein CBM2626_A10026 [Cupriavidus taiwanensis]